MQERTLTPRQVEALRGIVEDRTDQEIADAMGVCLGTEKRHVQLLYGTLGVRNRKQAFQAAVKRGWATVSGKWRGVS